ncbi:Putative cationic amino acid transporter [Myotis davidii]|nr:Putative cationic amino acid transporter [Myotis davidii]
MLIYFGYGIWNSTLEISAREEALHQSTYQSYDVDDPFSVEEGFSYATEGESQENWGGPSEDKGFYYQQMSDATANTRTSSKAKSKSKHKKNSEALIANDELDYSPE